jgi:hypothetical protein
MAKKLGKGGSNVPAEEWKKMNEKRKKSSWVRCPAMASFKKSHCAGNTKGGSITVPLTSCLAGLESAV